MIVYYLLVLIFFSFVLIKSADVVVVALRRLARNSKIGVYAVSAIILALGTSFPELAVSITSAIKDQSSFSLGVILGSNIANIALIGSVAALIHGRLNIHGDWLVKDYWISVGAGILPIILILDGDLSRIDGLILLCVYLAYATSLFKDRFIQVAQEHEQQDFIYRFWRTISHLEFNKGREYAKFFLGISFMLLASDIIVNFSGKMAAMLNIPSFIFALIFVSLGTSLPEFAFSLKSLFGGEPKMYFGNLLGSVIANSTLIIGIAALINPIKVVAFNHYLLASVAFIAVYGVFWVFIRTKRRLDRWESLVLIFMYLAFILFELAR